MKRNKEWKKEKNNEDKITKERTSKGGEVLRWKLLGVFCKVNRELTRRIFHKVHYLPRVSHPTPNLHTMLIEKKIRGVKSERPE